ncbi:hypothetical protein GCK72_025190 [Caenorhabditis remanei]|uniref:Uncharacterized protein n=1 Tax=Caenorhabditis remanei TaxID=31234 RepID=A0A6A5G1Q1_CAERE|nr:hypothetical protein GCK72_025190 [Caenorhabditis remanei]KAF1748723.1 hypothetical protein GCK72_025190 [Caenorhabditis remanei]
MGAKRSSSEEKGKNYARQQSSHYPPPEYQQSLCDTAQAFRKPKNRMFDSEMSMYLLGTLNIDKISQLIHHNNTNHQGSTVEQCVYGEYYKKSSVLKEVIEAVEQLEVMDQVIPPPICKCAGED